jgi:hypothetical protein
MPVMRVRDRRALSKDSSCVTAITPASTISEDTFATASWWLWISWLEREGNSGFVFGCAARSFHAAGWTDDATLEISDGGRLTVHQCTVTDEVFGRFQNELWAGTVDLSIFVPSKALRASVKATRSILQEGLGQSAVRTALHYTLPNVEALVGKAEGALEGVLSILLDQLNLRFKDV